MAEIKLKPIYIDGEDIGVPGSDTYIKYWEKRHNEEGANGNDLWLLEHDTIQDAFQKDITKNYPGENPYGSAYFAFNIFQEKGLLSTQTQQRYDYGFYSEKMNPKGKKPPNKYDDIAFLQPDPVRPKPKMQEGPKVNEMQTSEPFTYNLSDEGVFVPKDDDIVDGGILPEIKIEEKSNEEKHTEKERKKAPRVQKANVVPGSTNLNNNDNTGVETNEIGEVIVNNDTNQYRNIQTDTSDVVAEEPFPTPGTDGNLIRYDNESDEDYNKRNNKYKAESKTPKEKIDEAYIEYRGNVGDIDDPYFGVDGEHLSINLDMIDRNIDPETGEDDYARAWDKITNKEGILSKKEWYELNKENKTLPKGSYDLNIDNDGNYFDKKPVEKIKVEQNTEDNTEYTVPTGEEAAGINPADEILPNPGTLNIAPNIDGITIPNPKAEDGSNSQSNFQNNPAPNSTNDYRLLTEQEEEEQFGQNDGTDAKRITYKYDETDLSTRLQTKKESADENIQTSVEEDQSKLLGEIKKKEKEAGIGYKEGGVNVKTLDNSKNIFGDDGTSVISIDGMQHHAGDPKNTTYADPELGGASKQEAYVYGPTHEKYVEGAPNLMSNEDIDKFKARLWMFNFDLKKQKFYDSLTEKERKVATKEGMTGYLARKEAEFENFQLGLTDRPRLQGLVKNNEAIDYDITDLQAYSVKKIENDSKRFKKDFEEKEALLLSKAEEKVEEDLGRAQIIIQRILDEEFKQNAALGRFDGLTENQMKKWYLKAANHLMRSAQEKSVAQHEGEFNKLLQEWAETYMPPKIISDETYSQIDKELEKVGFIVLPNEYKRNVLDNLWKETESKLMEQKMHPDVITDMQNEFYLHYYEKIAFDEQGQLSTFAMEDFANNALEMGAEERYEQLVRTVKRTKEESNEMEALRWTIGFAKEILNSKESILKDRNFQQNLRRSFSKKMSVETIPFFGFMAQIAETADIYALNQKQLKGEKLSAAEQVQLDMFAIMNQHENAVKDISMGHRVGGMLADMVPYVGEFIMTAGTFTATRALVKRGLTKRLNKGLLKKAKYASVKKGGLGAVKRRVSRGVNFTSFLAGTLAQTTANPQQYIKHLIDNMTDEMRFMHTSDGDELINLLDRIKNDDTEFGNVSFGARFVPNTGDPFIKAFRKAYLITWAEFATERLGQSIPMFGKYMSKRMFANPEWFKRYSLGYYLNKKGLTGGSSLYRKFQKNASWDGVLGETFEELVNLPLSNLIMGEKVMTGMNTQFVGDLLATTGIAQVAFGGISMGHNLYTGRRAEVMRIGFVDYDSYADFKAALDKEIKNNTLGDKKVKVTGSFINFMQAERALKESGNIANFDRADFDKQVAERATKREIEILNKLTEGDRNKVLDLNKQIDSLSDTLRILGYEPEINVKQIKETKNKITELRGEKGEIIKDVAADIIKQDVKKAQRMADKIYGKGKVVIKELESLDAVREVAHLEVMEELGYDMNDVVVTQEQDGSFSVIYKGKQIEKSSLVEIKNGVESHVGADGFVGVSSGNVFINTTVASKTGAINAVAHEMLHKVLAKSLDENPEIAEAIANALSVELDRLGGKMVASEIQERLALYLQAPTEMQAEEKLTLFLDALRTGDITLEQSFARKVGDMISRVFAHMGMNIKFGNGQDVITFLKNFDYQFQKGVVTKQLKEVATMDGKQIKLTGNLSKHIKDVKNLIKARKAKNTRMKNELKKDPEKAFAKYGNEIFDVFKFSKSLPTKVDQNKDELFANSNRALDEAVESIYGLSGFSSLPVEEQADFWNTLEKEDKLIIGYQVGLEWQLYTLKHIKLKLTDDAGIRTNDQGQKDYTLRNDLINNITIGVENENGVPFMVNTWNPTKAKLTTHLFGLIPLRIPAAARQIPGFFSIKVSEEKGDKQSTSQTKKKEESKGEDIKLYEYPWVVPFNDKTKYQVTAKEIHIAIVGLIKQGKIDIASLNSYKDVRSVIPQEIIDMVFKFFGIKPKPGNLTKTDIKNAQLKIEFNYNFIFGNFPQGYNSENKSTGTTNVLMTERPTKKNKLKEPKNVFYEELETPDITKDEQGNIIEVKTKAKRPVNLKIQRKIKNPGKEAILEVFGVTETKGSADNLYKKEDNTSSRIRAVVMEHAVLFVNQAVVEVENNPSSLISQALNDGKAPFRFSKSLPTEQQVIFETGLPKFARDVVKTNATTNSEIMASLDKTFKNKTLTDKSKKLIAKEVLKVVGQYKALELKHRGAGARKVIMPQKLNQFIESYYKNQDEETALFSLLKDLLPTSITHIKNGKKVKTEIKNIGVTFKILERIQKNRTAILNIYNKQIAAGTMTTEEAIAKTVRFLKGMLQGASKISDGSIVIKNGVPVYVPSAEWDAYVKDYRKSKEKILKDGTVKKGPAPMNRKQFFDNVEDFMANFVEEIQGAEVRAKNGKFLTVGKIEEKYKFEKAYAETSKSALEDPYGQFKGRESQAQEAREEIERIFDDMFADVYSKNGKYDFVDIAMMATTMGSGMKSIMRKAANLKYIANGVMKIPVGKRGSELEYEHMIPQVVMMMRVLNSYINTGRLDKNVWEGYHVAIIPSTMDKMLTKLGFRSAMPMFGDRYFNMFTFGNPGLAYLISLDPKDKGTKKEFKGKNFVEAGKLLTKQNLTYNERMIIGKAYKLSKSLGASKGITVLDFDDTLATSKSLIEYVTPEGTNGTLTPAEYASTYQDLLGLGYKFDFSQFNKVVDGKVAPLFQKALKLQNKFGPSNMFVLTARPAESAPAIFAFLKANGLNIPLKNITGLANSTAEAKALWIAEKAAEGYNDFYFADDALQNVQAVQNMLDQFDVKSKVQLAKLKLSKSLPIEFNEILEDVTGIDAKKQFNKAKAGKRGAGKGRFRPFVPPGAEDFVGLLYNFMGKGKMGEKHRAFFEKHLINPFNLAYEKINISTQRVNNEYYALRKNMKPVVKKLTKQSKLKDYSNGDAIRVYLWSNAGFEIPGISEKDQKILTEYVEENGDLKSFALALGKITQLEKGYIEPSENWTVGNIASDLHDLSQQVNRAEFLSEFIENADAIFSEKNLNKIEAAFGSNFRSALEDMLYRMKFGSSRPRGLNKTTNIALNFINKGVSTIMFFNGRSALLQTISFVNFINYSDNNIFRFSAAYANFPQFIKDFSDLFNSDYLKSRRSGMKQDLNAAEMLEATRKSKNRVGAMISYILEKGFLPTKMADSFAIALGGAAFYRNRVNSLMKRKKMTKKQAEEQAMKDFRKIAEETQQSSRPDFISQQQASLLGHFILAFGNTPMQYVRLQKKAALDIINRRRSSGYDTLTQSNIANFSRIMYYGVAQNIIFYGLQTALFALLFEDNDEDDEDARKRNEFKYDRMANGMIDTILRGTGLYGAVVSMIKNYVLALMKEEEKGFSMTEANPLVEVLNVSPPLGSKARKLVQVQRTIKFNKEKIKDMPLTDINNPIWDISAKYIQVGTNAPTDRILNKAKNMQEAMNESNAAWQRLFLLMGWDRWGLGVEDRMREFKSKKKRKKVKRSN